MNWFIFALICTLGWGFADLFYKMGSGESDRYSHMKTAVWVGLVMGVAAFCMMPFAETANSFSSIVTGAVKYSPASISYIISMVVGYAGLRYLELSIVSPVQNASGALSAVFMFVYFAARGTIGSFAEEFSVLDIAGTAVIVVGVMALAVVEHKLAKAEAKLSPSDRKYRFGALALLFPILYCVFDTVGTAADGIILDGETGLGLGEIDVLILYGLTFMLAGAVAWIFLLIKEKKPYNPFAKSELIKGAAAVCEEFGQIFYVYAMAARPVLAAPMVASYCIVSVILSRIFIKEKMKRPQYACVALVIAGILMLGVSEGLAEASPSYEPISAEEMCETLEKSGYPTEDVTEKTSEEFGTDRIVRAIASENGPILFDFFEMESDEAASMLYDDYVKLVKSESGTDFDDFGTDGYSLLSAEISGIHTVIVRVGNTFVYAACSEKFGEKVDVILREIGYIDR